MRGRRRADGDRVALNRAIQTPSSARAWRAASRPSASSLAAAAGGFGACAGGRLRLRLVDGVGDERAPPPPPPPPAAPPAAAASTAERTTPAATPAAALASGVERPCVVVTPASASAPLVVAVSLELFSWLTMESSPVGCCDLSDGSHGHWPGMPLHKGHSSSSEVM